MPDVKCKKCKTIFLTEAPDRLKFPICGECLVQYREWLDKQYPTNKYGKECGTKWTEEWVGNGTNKAQPQVADSLF